MRKGFSRKNLFSKDASARTIVGIVARNMEKYRGRLSKSEHAYNASNTSKHARAAERELRSYANNYLFGNSIVPRKRFESLVMDAAKICMKPVWTSREMKVNVVAAHLKQFVVIYSTQAGIDRVALASKLRSDLSVLFKRSEQLHKIGGKIASVSSVPKLGRQVLRKDADALDYYKRNTHDFVANSVVQLPYLVFAKADIIEAAKQTEAFFKAMK